MTDQNFIDKINKRRTFAIISHPDAGKTTITEKLLLFGKVLQQAGTVKGRKTGQHAKSDWMVMEKDRGISVTTSVMQFPYQEFLVNLLDTPGHKDFSEDTYRTLTAVDSCLMVIDAAKGVEERTIKLMEVARLRDTPIITFINKLDRDSRDPFELIDDIEKTLTIMCAPVTWPIGSGKGFKGVYHILNDEVIFYKGGQGQHIQNNTKIKGLANPALDELFADEAAELREQVSIIKGACQSFDLPLFLSGKLTPVFFGTALGNFGVNNMLDALVQWAPAPKSRKTNERTVLPLEENFTGFIFKIQANMDPKHRDRIAFMRICSGKYQKGMKLHHLRIGKIINSTDAMTFMAGDRQHTDESFPGDIIGLHNHGTIQIGDTFTQGEQLKFTGIPHFAPELFRRIILQDPMKTKQLQKGIRQLSEEGAVQLFRPLRSNDIIVGAIGVLQFEVIAYRLATEYKVIAKYETININTARWVSCQDAQQMQQFKRKAHDYLAIDEMGALVYLAPGHVNLSLAIERYPAISFQHTKER